MQYTPLRQNSICRGTDDSWRVVKDPLPSSQVTWVHPQGPAKRGCPTT